MIEVSITMPFDEIQNLKEVNKYSSNVAYKETVCRQDFHPYYDTEASREIDCDISDLHMPEPIAQLVTVIKNRYPAITVNSIINMVHTKIAQMLTAKRIKYIEIGSSGYPNYYSIIFMPSGAGKDRLSNELDKYVMFPFQKWFELNVNVLKQNREITIRQEADTKFLDEKQEKQKEIYINKKLKGFRNLVIEISDGTREGLYCDAKAFKEAEFGSLMIKFAELGQYMSSMTTEQKLFFNTLFEAYDGKIVSKCIKSEQRRESIEDIPVNTLMYSDPTLFKGSNLEKIFNALMETGLGRRCIITFMDKEEPYEMETDGNKYHKEEEKYYRDLKALGEKFYKIFDSIKPNTCYELADETSINVFHPYKVKLSKLNKKTSNTLLKKEIKSRELKVLKMSCLYASINHPEESYINPLDMKMAIATVERLSKDFLTFVEYRPVFEDKYDRMLQFFLKNEGKYFSKTELMTKHRQKFGYSRDNFRKNFEYDIEIVAEMAKSENYALVKRPINNNSGNEYSLVYVEAQELSQDVMELDDLI